MKRENEEEGVDEGQKGEEGSVLGSRRRRRRQAEVLACGLALSP